MATIKDVAKLAGASPATVSRVLSSTVVVSPKTKTRIEKAIAELDFRPNAHARALVSKSTHTSWLTPFLRKWPVVLKTSRKSVNSKF